MAQLSVQLTADIKRIEAALKKVRKDLVQTGETAESSAKKVAQTGNTAARGLTNLNKGAANATPTLQEFSRVIQDAPFGIQGVANNITQLVQNFGHLQKSAGGTRAALSALITSFAGPAGILFVVSAATSLLVSFGSQMGKSADKAKELKDKIDDVNAAFDLELKRSELIEESLELQNKSTLGILQGRQGIYKQQLLSLAALLEEQKQQLETQKIENNRVSGWEAIKAVIGEVTEELKINLGLTQILDKVLTNIAAQTAVIWGIEAERLKTAGATTEDKRKESELSRQVAELENQRLSILNQIAKLQSTIVSLKEREAQIPVQGVTAGTTPVGDAIAEQIKAGDLPGKVAAPLSQIEQLWVQTATNINKLGENSLAQGITNTFNNVGRALADGQNLFSAMGAGIIGAFGNFLSQFGNQLVSYGVAALAFSTVSKGLLNPITAGPSAIAAIAIGAALSVAGGALSSIASGGLGGSSSGGGTFQAPSNDFTGSRTSFASGGAGGGRVVFEIQGRTLVGVIRKELGSQGQLGGLGTING